MSEELLKTPFYDLHIKHGAKMVPFAGYEMPVQYTGIKEEHHAVREKAGLFDVSHMGEVEFSGSGAAEFIDYLMTNDIMKLQEGQAIYTVMCKPDGGIIDDLIVYRTGPERYLICLNAANRKKDANHMANVLSQHELSDKVQMERTSDNWAQLALQGPLAEKILQTITTAKLNELKRFHHVEAPIKTSEGEVTCLIARTGYTGEDGFEIYIPVPSATAVFNAIYDAGEPEGMVCAGLGCRDTLRLEARYMLYGNDIDEEHNPYEAGLSWVVKMKKGVDFIGKNALRAAKKEIKRRLEGFTLEGKGILRAHYPITVEGKEVGEFTSGSYAPSLDCSIGLGYIDASVPDDAKFFVKIRNKEVPLKIVKKPFLDELKK